MVREYTTDKRAKSVGFSFDEKRYKANDFRLKMIKQFGARSLKSLKFTVEQTTDSIHFRGNGMGHGVGLCQWGALGFAESGWNYTDILRFYYRGIEIKPVYFDSEKNYLELAQ
jgi:stage II sporulation protein D